MRALTNMSFNLGNRLGQFHLFLNAVSSHDWPRAAAEMRNSLWYKQVGARGERLAKEIETGADSDGGQKA